MRSLEAWMLMCLLLVSGCVSPAQQSPQDPALPPLGSVGKLAFSTPMIISKDHAGGEPAIIVTPKGTILLATHPGFTHSHGLPPSANTLTSATAESYMWRSTDQGETWAYVGLPGQQQGPRGPGRGVGDPDFAIDGKGRVYFTDLNALATDSVSRSDDDGQTWLVANNAAQGAVDRQWLAAYKDSVWIAASFLDPTSRPEIVSRSDDGGLTWTQVGQGTVEGKLVANPLDGTLFLPAAPNVEVSRDGGKTWTKTGVEGHTPDNGPGRQGTPAEGTIAIDRAGNGYIAWSEQHDIWLAATRDNGATWLPPIALTAKWSGATRGTHAWPWVVAGDEGKVAVVWYAADEEADSAQTVKGSWRVEAAAVSGADTANATWSLGAATGTMHKGPICLRGTFCQDDQQGGGGDRRLGDLFEAALLQDGRVAIAYADTEAVPGDSVSHPGFVILEEPRLLASALKRAS